MAAETTIIVADDHPIFRQGLRQLIEKESGFRVVAEAENGEIALKLIKTHLPMVAVLDLDMPEMDGFSVAGQVQKLKLPVKVIILTMHKDELHFNQANLTVTNGLSGFSGGGIYNRSGSTLTLTDSIVSNNSSQFGGGILNREGCILILTNSTVSNNSATGSAYGGIYNDGTATLTNSTVSGNSVAYYSGIGNSGTLTLTNSTVTNNSASVEIGGVIMPSTTARSMRAIRLSPVTPLRLTLTSMARSPRRATI